MAGSKRLPDRAPVHGCKQFYPVQRGKCIGRSGTDSAIAVPLMALYVLRKCSNSTFTANPVFSLSPW